MKLNELNNHHLKEWTRERRSFGTPTYKKDQETRGQKRTQQELSSPAPQEQEAGERGNVSDSPYGRITKSKRPEVTERETPDLGAKLEPRWRDVKNKRVLVTPEAQKREMYAFLMMMLARQGKTESEIKTFLKALEAEISGNKEPTEVKFRRWVQNAKTGDSTTISSFGRKLGVTVMEGVLLETSMSTVLMKLSPTRFRDNEEAKTFLYRHRIRDENYDIERLNELLARSRGDIAKAVKMARTGLFSLAKRIKTPFRKKESDPNPPSNWEARKRLKERIERKLKEVKNNISEIAGDQYYFVHNIKPELLRNMKLEFPDNIKPYFDNSLQNNIFEIKKKEDVDAKMDNRRTVRAHAKPRRFFSPSIASRR